MMDVTPRIFAPPAFIPAGEAAMQTWLAERFAQVGWTVYREATFKLQRKGKREARRMDLYLSPPASHPLRMRLGPIAIEAKLDEHTADVLNACEQAEECLFGFKYAKPGGGWLVRPNLALIACDESLGFKPESAGLLVLERMLWRRPGELGVLRYDHLTGRCWYERSDGDGCDLFGGRR